MKIDPEQWRRLSPLLDEWLELPREARAGWLDRLRPEHSDLLPLLRDLVEHGTFAESDAFLDHLPVVNQPSVEPPAAPNGADLSAGTQVGPYRLIRELGVGGMGVVWLAERADGAVKRPIALKLPIAPLQQRGLGERFARERDILAQLNHPHIARLYDAGIASDGHPYLALEYIEGEPITAYCDRQCLALEARLQLFVAVLRAVQYAHSNLVVHRDLKPSNIMVTSGGEVRLLDFGIAKLLIEGEARETELTRIGGRAMTPDYASPEQITGAAITTASDVYSLGVVFYELLTGERPYRLKRDTLGGLEDAIVAAEIVRPSQAVRSDARASSRASSPKRLANTLKGDLDTIALKALQKQASQRYATADAFAQDIDRYLTGEPVLAQGESTWYRVRKFVRRNKLAVASATAVAAALSIGLGVALWQAHVAVTEKRRADTESATAQAVNDFLRNDLLAQASPNTQAGPKEKPDPNLTVRLALDRAAARISGRFGKQPLVEASVRQTIGDTYKDLGLFPEARQQMERALSIRRRLLGDADKDTLATMNNLALLYIRQGYYAPAEPLSIKVVEVRRRILGAEHTDTLTSIDNLSELYWHQGKYQQAQSLATEVLNVRRRVLGEQHADTLSSMNNLALLYAYQGKYAPAEPLFLKIVEVKRRVLGPEHPSTLNSMNNLAFLYTREGKYSDAEKLTIEAVRLENRVIGADHPETLTTSNNLAVVYQREGKFDLAEPLFTHILEVRSRVLGEQHPSTLVTMSTLAGLLTDRGKYPEAEKLLSKALELDQRTLGDQHPNTLSAMDTMAVLYRDEGQFKRAEPLFAKVLDARMRVLGNQHPDTLMTMMHLAELYRDKGDYARAEPLFSKVLEGRRRALGASHPDTADAMTLLGEVMLLEQKCASAETVLRDSLRIHEEVAADAWRRYRAQILLGASLMGQGKFREAGPLLVSGREGMVARRSAIPFASARLIAQSNSWLEKLHNNSAPE